MMVPDPKGAAKAGREGFDLTFQKINPLRKPRQPALLLVRPMGLIRWITGSDRSQFERPVDRASALAAGYQHRCSLPNEGDRFVCPDCGCPWHFRRYVVDVKTSYKSVAVDPSRPWEGTREEPLRSDPSYGWRWVCDPPA